MKNEKLKNIFLVFAALVFALGILITSVVRTTALTTSPNYKIAPVKATPTPTETVKKPVEYSLAYPGPILPGHILYPIKMVRDRIWLWLTVDPLKKAEVLLLFADKRLGAGKALIEAGKEELGASTLTKAGKYLESAVKQEKIAREKGKDTQALLERLSRASLKHEEVLLEIKGKVGETAKPVIESCLGYVRWAQQQVRQILGE
ncbi:hypothetical protein CO054_03010 [Candidatus Shapirobacteria bacterium CG_4_9_14_0_2_um_filter_39_11]|uniref:DUF5667 domain-containing protein n=1 Tax=Candidatus Shapirobacteria bacterium CG_4_9_14_0_2_um_filter_39_11 TaxID=1974478 RepID=A0A2M8ERY5_9BACT|nr:MAG: hypothetical protein CO054_03010 [Candidatus Shapirobacteria bacterium CG_4_9_14_0_2_um_filter_39_11]